MGKRGGGGGRRRLNLGRGFYGGMWRGEMTHFLECAFFVLKGCSGTQGQVEVANGDQKEAEDKWNAMKK